MKTAREILEREFKVGWQVNFIDRIIPMMEEYAAQYKNQSQPIEKDEMLTMAADAYKDLLSRYKELEAQLKEFQILVYQMLVYFNNASPLTLATMSEDEYVKRFIKAKHEVIKALESSPTEHVHSYGINGVCLVCHKLIEEVDQLKQCSNPNCPLPGDKCFHNPLLQDKKMCPYTPTEQPEAQKPEEWRCNKARDCDRDVIKKGDCECYNKEQQNQPQPEKAQEEQSELIGAYKEYIALLIDEINSLTGMAYVHGWRSSNVEKGEACRKKIEELTLKQTPNP